MADHSSSEDDVDFKLALDMAELPEGVKVLKYVQMENLRLEELYY